MNMNEVILAWNDALAQRMMAARAALPQWVRAQMQWYNIMLAVIIVGSLFLGFTQLANEGYANTYYASSVKSMLTSWHNFSYVAADAQGYVALDKPPLGFWMQAISAKLFGFSGVSILLPEVLAGVLAVVLVYILVRRAFGPLAGLLAAVALALNPISLVTERNNTVDSLLVLVLLLGAWTVMRAAETGQLRWLRWSAVAVGLSFNIKMLEAYLVVPAFALVYGLGAPQPWRTKLKHLALAAVVLLAVSLAWALSVDLTPASQRPFISDSGSNSELSLILGYNGIGRLASLFPDLHALQIVGITIDLSLQPAFAPNIGDPGIFRLLTVVLGSQVSWLLPLAVVGLVAVLNRQYLPGKASGTLQERRGDGPASPSAASDLAPTSSSHGVTLNRQRQAIALWGGWLVVVGGYFSVSRFFHLYYLTILAPAIAALVGIGLVALWQAYRRDDMRAWLLPVALVATVIAQAHFLSGAPAWNPGISPLIIGVSLVIAGGLATLFIVMPAQGELTWRPLAIFPAHLRQRWLQPSRIVLAVILLGFLVTLIAPAAWSAASIAAGDGGRLARAVGASRHQLLRPAGIRRRARQVQWQSGIRQLLTWPATTVPLGRWRIPERQAGRQYLRGRQLGRARSPTHHLSGGAARPGPLPGGDDDLVVCQRLHSGIECARAGTRRLSGLGPHLYADAAAAVGRQPYRTLFLYLVQRRWVLRAGERNEPR